MKRGVKRQTEDQADEPSKEEDSPEKKLRIDANLLRFEQMKKEAEENRRRVRDQYLKEHEQEKLLNVHEGTTSSSSTSRRETIAAVPSSRTQHSTSKSTSKIVPTKSPAKPKASLSTASKSSRKSSPKTPSKTPSKSSDVTLTKSSSKGPSKDPSKPASKTPTKTPTKTPPKNKKPSTPATSADVVSTVPTSPAVLSSSIALTHLSSEDDEKIADKMLDGDDVTADSDDWCGQLYPSIAFSDAINAVGHLCAAFVAATNGQEIAALGFLSVWLAAIIGVLRFGVSEKLFQQANSDLANLAGFVGYPLIGMSFVAQHYKDLNINVVFIGFMLVAWETLTRSFIDVNKDAAKLATNIVFFVGPIAAVCHETKDYQTLGALVAFVVAGIIITPHHDNRIAGVRCVDWFHVIIGVTAYFFVQGLLKV